MVAGGLNLKVPTTQQFLSQGSVPHSPLLTQGHRKGQLFLRNFHLGARSFHFPEALLSSQGAGAHHASCFLAP